MLATHFRLRRSQDFETVRKHGKRWGDGVLNVNVLAGTSDHNRFGFVVGRRVGKAAKRNRVKRQLRAVVFNWLVRLSPGHDIVIIAQQRITAMSYQEIEGRLHDLFQSAGLFVVRGNA